MRGRTTGLVINFLVFTAASSLPLHFPKVKLSFYNLALDLMDGGE